jgi:two-component system NarL family sensor kinase
MQDKQPEQQSLFHENRELGILYEIAGYLNRQIDVHEALQEVLARVTELLGLRTGWVWIFNEQGEPVVAASQYLPPYLADHHERMTGSCICLDTFMQGTSERPSNVDVLRCSRLKNAERDSDPSALGLRFHSSVPIYAGNTLLGVMNVASEDWRELDYKELQLLHIISDQIGLALQRASLSAEHTRAAARLATIEERNRLAREIHDTLAQGLAAISLQLETADTLAESRPERTHEAIKRALKLARSNLEETRRSVMDLRAAPLQGYSLAEALTNLIKQERSTLAHTEEHRLGLQENHPVNDPTKYPMNYHYHYSPPQPFPTLPSRVEAGLYRIAQEALTNARKHASASHIKINLIAEEQWASLIVEDDGIGFDPEKVAQQSGISSGHFGLAGINERAHILGGSICIQSAPGAGTRIEVSIPY